MNTYEKSELGKIILMRNITFKNPKTDKEEIDHAWRNGRPCIIIYSDNEFDYFVTIKSNITNEQFQKHYIPFDETNLLYKQINKFGTYNRKNSSEKQTKGQINLETIYKTPISGHDEIGKITFKTYKEIINKITKYYKKNNLEKIFKEAKTIRGR